MASAKVPNLVKHCTLAIWKSGDIAGGKRERFVSAWNIARARLVQYGYLAKGSESGTAEDIKLTSKGVVREAEHTREAGGTAKSMHFDQMFPWIELAANPDSTDQPATTSQKDRVTTTKVDRDTAVVRPLLNKPKPPTPKSKLGGPFKPVTPFGKKKPK